MLRKCVHTGFITIKRCGRKLTDFTCKFTMIVGEKVDECTCCFPKFGYSSSGGEGDLVSPNIRALPLVLEVNILKTYSNHREQNRTCIDHYTRQMVTHKWRTEVWSSSLNMVQTAGLLWNIKYRKDCFAKIMRDAGVIIIRKESLYKLALKFGLFPQIVFHLNFSSLAHHPGSRCSLCCWTWWLPMVVLLGPRTWMAYCVICMLNRHLVSHIADYWGWSVSSGEVMPMYVIPKNLNSWVEYNNCEDDTALPWHLW